METKLTIRLKKEVIDHAKKYAHDHETSLSRLIENYLSAIGNESGPSERISALVESLSGIILLPEAAEPKAQYHEHLKNKYL